MVNEQFLNIRVFIGGADVTEHVALPIKWNALLDERLDEGRLSLRKTSTPLYKIGAEVQIKVGNNVLDFIVSADESTETPAGSGVYSHELSIIEPTKILEGIVVESLTFTNPLSRIYTDNPVTAPAYFAIQNESYQWVDERYIQTPYDMTLHPVINSYITPISNKNNLEIEAINKQMTARNGGKFIEFDLPGEADGDCPKLTAISPSGKIYKKYSYDESIIIVKPEIGVWQMYYNVAYKANSYNSVVFRVRYEIVVVKDQVALKKWNIKTVTERVLNFAIPHLKGVGPQFILDPKQEDFLANITSPEFAFTKKTLKEILDTIGGYIHAIPRLIRGESGRLDTVRFDLLGGNDQATVLNKPYVSQTLSQNIEDYATALDSSADNLVCTLSPEEGAVVDPGAKGAKTPRSEELYARIEENNLVISTQMPIYTIQKLEYIDENDTFNLTPYVFEATEYGRLSSFDTSYPSSKAFAIYFEQGKPNIKGLMFKPPKATFVGSGAWAEMYSIVRILKAVGAQTNKFGAWGNTPPYPTMRFRVTYTPIFSTRTSQHKTYSDNNFERVKIYNQSANIIETRYYGENMKGAIDRMGNAELVRTYRTTELSDIPKIGQVGEINGSEYYISSVTTAIFPQSVNFTVGFSKDFNRISQYIGVDSEWRAYEVSEKRAYRREILYEDYCIFGAQGSENNSGKILYEYAETAFKNYLSNSINNNEPCDVKGSKIKFTDCDKRTYYISLPVISVSFGSSISFAIKCEDNYSAGAKSEQGIYADGSNKITGYWNTDVPYSDYFGRAESMEIWLTNYMAGIKSEEEALDLPHVKSSIMGTVLFARGEFDLDKDGGEAISFTYQLNFITADSKLIIGEALARYCPFVSNKRTNNYKVYAFGEKIGRFQKSVNIKEATGETTFSWTENTLTTKSPLTCKSWALIVEETGEILLAKNEELTNEIVKLSLKFSHTRS